MPDKILVCLAWPYANGSLHVGHLAGVYVPGDIFARFHRMLGNQVLMVSGSDEHGTPITVRADAEGVSPKEITDRYHAEFCRNWEQLGISWDIYTRTETENHWRVTQDIFLRLLEKGYIFKDKMIAPYDPAVGRFLPDRYVEGECPYCHFPQARGDECPNEGRPLDPRDLINARSRLSGQPPVFKETEHFFLDLPKFNQLLLEWVRDKTYWRPNVYRFTINYLEQGLQPRAITRDIEWGVPIPVPGYESKRIYVWFDAVIGYLSASIEWAQRVGEPEKWREWWQDPEARSYYFIGKDNIFFHTIIWPAELMGYGGLNLPYDVPANEFMTLEGRPISTSRNWAVWVPDLLAKYDPDPIRYYISANMPESSDTDFSMREFIRRNNDELVATWGNLVHRTLTFVQRYFKGRVPGREGGADPAVVERIEATFQYATDNLQHVRFKDTIREIMALAQFGNRYFDEKAPWRLVKDDRESCAEVMGTLLDLINALKVLFYPFLPFSSSRLHQLLGFTDEITSHGWKAEAVPRGQQLPPPSPLFVKLEE